MLNYNYYDAVKSDILDYIKENDIDISTIDRDKLYDDLFDEDSVTGNGSGSYTFNSNTAETYVDANKPLLNQAIEEDFISEERAAKFWLDDNFEALDVVLRVYVLSSSIDQVLAENHN